MDQGMDQVDRSGVTGNPLPGSSLSVELAAVRDLAASGRARDALRLARELHARHGSAETEDALLAAYKARIGTLIHTRMYVEAQALIESANARIPRAAAELDEMAWQVHASTASLDTIVEPLGSAELSGPGRARIEDYIRQKVDDLAALAGTRSLAPDHPLRVAAGALDAAFRAVTSGPVAEGSLDLPEVSRQSPLSSWKDLIRAIECYYRGKDRECALWLRAIVPDSVPAGLLPAMKGLLPAEGGAGKQSLPGADNREGAADGTGPEKHLIALTGGIHPDLPVVLRALDKALNRSDRKVILRMTRIAFDLTEGLDPTLQERVRAHIFARSLVAAHLKQKDITCAAGMEIPPTAYLYQLSSLLLESGDPRVDHCCHLCSAKSWERFRTQAIQEQWFQEGSLADGLVVMHQAELIDGAPEESLDRHNIPDLAEIYENGCAAEQSAESYEKWVRWAEKDESEKEEVEFALETWASQRPGDIQPLVRLMLAAERRKAYKKALAYLERAEKIDRLNPEVRQGRIRLIVASACTHLKQSKFHLIPKDAQSIEAVEEIQAGSTRTLALLLHLAAELLQPEAERKTEIRRELKSQIGTAASVLLVSELLRHAGLPLEDKWPALATFNLSPEENLSQFMKAVSIADWAGISLDCPVTWDAEMASVVRTSGRILQSPDLVKLAEIAVRSRCRNFAGAAIRLGLAQGSANARFLFLRTRIAYEPFQRRAACMAAAIHLARTDHDNAMIARISDDLGEDWTQMLSGLDLSAGLVRQIVDEESRCDSWSQPGKPVPAYLSEFARLFSAAAGPGRKRPQTVEELAGEMGVPPQLMRQFIETLRSVSPQQLHAELVQAATSGMSPEQAMRALFTQLFGSLGEDNGDDENDEDDDK